MFSLSPIKIVVILAVIIVLLGPDKLPEVANKLGAGWRTLKKLQQRVEAEVREAVPDLPSSAEIARMVRSPVNLLNTMADRAKDELHVELPDLEPDVVTTNPPSSEVGPSPSSSAGAPAPPTPMPTKSPVVEPRIVSGNEPHDPSLN